MSIFKTSWVIIKINSIKNNEFLFDIFSYDYWKIKLKAKKSKKEKSLDIWYIINFEVNVKKENSIHEIKNVKIKNEFDYLNKDYQTIFEYLEILKILNYQCPLNMSIPEIYNILNEINNFENITEEKLIFSKLKILFILWILKIDNEDKNIEKILSFISKESIKNVLKLKWLDEKTKIKLKNILVK